MVGEGGNLGFTQRGRVEYALNGGLDLHRRHRQLGRCRLQRPRGQHQDPPRRCRRRRRVDDEAAQRAARVDDRRGRRPRARQQQGPDAGAGDGPQAVARHGQRPRPLHRDAGDRGLARSAARVPAVRPPDRRTAARRHRAHRPRVRRADRLHEEHQRRRDGAQRPPRRRRCCDGDLVELLPDAAARAVRRGDPSPTRCGARSSPRSSSTRWSTCRGSPSTTA